LIFHGCHYPYSPLAKLCHITSQLLKKGVGADKDWSGRRELNPGPLAPHASALAGLRYAPII
jgi:hypothetical protein